MPTSAARRWRETWSWATSPEVLPPRHQRLALAATLVVTLVTRLVLIRGPALDRTHWKEIDFQMVARGFQGNGFALWRPEVTWPADGVRFTAMELPVVPWLTGLGFSAFGEGPLVARAFPALCWVGVAAYVFLLARRELGPLVGLAASIASVLMVLWHPFGNYVFSEPLLLLASVAAVHHYAAWLDTDRRAHQVTAVAALSLGLALKPTVLFLGLPLLFLLARRHGAAGGVWRCSIVMALLALLPPVLWYAWAWWLERNGIHHFSVFFGHDKTQTMAMLTDPLWWRTMSYHVGELLLGGHAGRALALVGLAVLVVARRGGLFLWWSVALAVYVVRFAEGNLDAPYYQLHAVPVLAVFVGAATVAIAVSALGVLRTRKLPLLLICAALVLAAFSVGRLPGAVARGLDLETPVHPARWRLAQTVRRVTPPDALLVTAGEYSVHAGGNDLSPVLFHYSQRRGWILVPGELDPAHVAALVARGATHLAVLPSFSDRPGQPLLRDDAGQAFVREMSKRYRTVHAEGEQRLFDLRSGAEQGDDRPKESR